VIEVRAEQFTRPGYSILVAASGIWTDVTFLRSSESKASAMRSLYSMCVIVDRLDD